jgi:hypothetical protein
MNEENREWYLNIKTSFVVVDHISMDQIICSIVDVEIALGLHHRPSGWRKSPRVSIGLRLENPDPVLGHSVYCRVGAVC